MHVALGAQLGDRLEQIRETFQRHVGRRGGDEVMRLALHLWQRLEEVWVDADGHQPHAVE